MAHSEDTRRAVRARFVFDQLSLEVAAPMHGVPIATARRWIREARAAGDDWEKARSAQLIAGGGMEQVVRQTMAAMVQQVQATMDAIQSATDMPPAAKVQALASLADSYNKLMAASKRLMPETDRLAVAMDVISRFGEFIAKRQPALAGAFVEQMEAFGEELARAYA